MTEAYFYSHRSRVPTGSRSLSPTKPAIVAILANIKTLAKVNKVLKPYLQKKIKVHALYII